jgi:hypothetical protein
MSKPWNTGLGWLLALLGLILVVVIWFTGTGLDTDRILGLLALAFAAILL